VEEFVYAKLFKQKYPQNPEKERMKKEN